MQKLLRLVSLKKHIRRTSAEMRRIHQKMEQVCLQLEASLRNERLPAADRAQLQLDLDHAKRRYSKAIEDAGTHLEYFEYVLGTLSPTRRALLAMIPV